MKKFTFLVSFIMLFAFVKVGWGQVNMTTSGSYSQDFNTLANSGTTNAWTDNSTIANWYWQNTGTGTTYAADNGASNGGGRKSYGATSSTDRAIGSLGSGNAAAGSFAWGILLQNTSGYTITSIKISYKGEQWRNSAAAAQTISFFYKIATSEITSLNPNANTGWTSVSTLNFTSPITGGTSGALDGNISANSVQFTDIEIPSLSLANNNYIMLKWDDPDQTGSDHGLSIDDITITWVVDNSGNTVDNPSFNPVGGFFYDGQNVTISCATEGATIHYTTNGLDPDETSAIYTTPISVSATTTIKAKAYKTGMTASGISTATYSFPIEVADIATLRAGATDGTIYKLTGEALVTYTRAPRHQKYVQDATGAVLIDDNAGMITTTYNIGDGVTGLTGTLLLYNQLLEFIPIVDPGAATSTGNTITPEVKTLASITSADQAKLIKIKNVIFDDPTGNFAVNTNYNITDASGTSIFRTTFAESDYIGTPIPSNNLDLVVLVGQYNAAIQLTSRNLADITVYNPVTFNVDMSTATGFIPGTDVVYLAGSFPGAVWNEPGTNPDLQMSRVGSTLTYTITLQLPAGTYQYKYFKNSSWNYGEWDGEPNRILNVSGTIATNDVWALYNSTTWTGAVDSDWANAGNWTNNVPYEGLDVIIPAGLTNYPVLTANGSCQDITIASGASLLDGGFLTVAGIATVQQTIEGALFGTNDKWHLISQPVASILASDVFTYCYLKEFNELTGLYANIPGGTTLSTVGKGYSTMYSYESGAPTSKTLEFTGALNTGAQSVALTYTPGLGDGWNLVGNPYPSAIDWNATSGWSKPAEMNNGVYFWDNSIANYRYYLDGTGVNGGTNIIPAMQGFFVKATATPATNLGFANGIRVNNTTPAFYKSETTNPFLRLQVTNGNYSDETVVRFDANATSGADNAYDAWKLFADNVPQLYTSLDNNVDLAINTLPSVETSSIVPLNFKAGVTGNFTINATEILNFDAATPVILTDNVLNVTQNLCTTPVYTFTANAGDNSDRFTLRFKSSTGIGENNKQNVKIYANGNTIFINPGTTKLQGEVIVYDILGNQIVKNRLNNESSVYSISLNNPMGYYMVKLISAQGVYTQKVFIK